MISVAAFRHGAFPAFSPIKREKRAKQRAVFLMCASLKIQEHMGEQVVRVLEIQNLEFDLQHRGREEHALTVEIQPISLWPLLVW